MTMFKVSKVIDGDTFEVEGGWSWKKKDGEEATGTVIRPTGYDTPEDGEEGSTEATIKLEDLIEGEEVDLKNCVDIDRGRLVCDAYYDGKNLADYFPEYKS